MKSNTVLIKIFEYFNRFRRKQRNTSYYEFHLIFKLEKKKFNKKKVLQNEKVIILGATTNNLD
jgi:hypothetical protein